MESVDRLLWETIGTTLDAAQATEPAAFKAKVPGGYLVFASPNPKAFAPSLTFVPDEKDKS